MLEQIHPILPEKRIIVFLNLKGGVAKTTSAANIGARMADLGYRVMLIDLDAQANLSSVFLRKPANWYIHKAFLSPKEMPRPTLVRENLYLMPASLEMLYVEKRIISEMEREKILTKFLSKLVALNRFDAFIIDCPPYLGEVTKNALVAAQVVIVPITAEAFPLQGFRILEEEIDAVRQGPNPNAHIDKILINRYNKMAGINKDVAAYMEKNYADKLFKTKVRTNLKISEAQAHHQSIFEHDPKSNGAIDYAAVTDELLEFLTGVKNENETPEENNQ